MTLFFFSPLILPFFVSCRFRDLREPLEFFFFLSPFLLPPVCFFSFFFFLFFFFFFLLFCRGEFTSLAIVEEGNVERARRNFPRPASNARLRCKSFLLPCGAHGKVFLLSFFLRNLGLIKSWKKNWRESTVVGFHRCRELEYSKHFVLPALVRNPR